MTPGASCSLAARVAELQARLEAFRRDLEQGAASPGHGVMQDILEFVRTYDDEAACAALERTDAVAEFRARVAPHLLGFVWAAEQQTHRELMARAAQPRTGLGPLLGANPWGAYARMAGTLKHLDLSAFLAPRRKIMERIAQTAREGATIILRDPFFTGTLLFERVGDALPPRLKTVRVLPRTRGRFMLEYRILEAGPR